MQEYEVLSLCGLRIDGRKRDELRTLRHRFGTCGSSSSGGGGISAVGSGESDGWVYFEQGLNKVAVMVHGPQECRNKAKLDTLEEGKVLVVPVSALLCVAVCYLR
jgi:ribonuclease PH